MKRLIIPIFFILVIIAIIILTVFDYCESNQNFVESETSISKRIEEASRNPEYRKNFGFYPGLRNKSLTRPNSVPQIGIDLINNGTRASDGDIIHNYPYNANNFHIYFESNTTIPNYFYFKAAPAHKPTETILEAQFRVNRTPMSYDQVNRNKYYNINLYKIIDPHNLNETKNQELIASNYVSSSGKGVEIFNVTEVVKEWEIGVSQNLGFWVETVTTEGNLVPVKFERYGERTGHTNDAIILLYTFDTSETEILGNKLKRSCEKDVNVTSCRKKDLYVNLKSIWDDVIYPDVEFNAYYCDGSCYYPMTRAGTAHSIVQAIIHLSRPEVENPSCIPYKFDAMDVLQFNATGYAEKVKYKDMIVEECACV